MEEKYFVPYELALEMKALGFNEPCFKNSEHRKVCKEQEQPGGCQLHNLHCSYPNCTIDKTITPIKLPTYQQAFRWFREEYNIPSHIATHWQRDLDAYSYQYHFIEDKIEYNCVEHFESYEEAELALLCSLLEMANGILKRNYGRPN